MLGFILALQNLECRWVWVWEVYWPWKCFTWGHSNYFLFHCIWWVQSIQLKYALYVYFNLSIFRSKVYLLEVWRELEQLICYKLDFCQIVDHLTRNRMHAHLWIWTWTSCMWNVLTIQLQPLFIETMKSWKVILLCLHS